MFDFDLTDELKFKIRKLLKKNRKIVESVNKKIKEIINNDNVSINRYKNLRGNLKELKRVHIENCFVLVFKIDYYNNFILFADLDHHDRIY
jgi:YafQ family addiction module toxin component